MPVEFHARKSALGKEYLYRLYRRRVIPPPLAPFTAEASLALDLDAMRRGVDLVTGSHDFSAFASAGGSHTQPWRRIFAATLDADADELRLRFIGDGFLRGMVRALVGTLVEVGRGKRTVDSMRSLLEGQPRSAAGANAAACGLTLVRVYYPPSCKPLTGYEA